MEPRIPTPIDELADSYYQRSLDLSPVELTFLGSTERQSEYDDFSPDGVAAAAELAVATLRELDSLETIDAVDQVSAAALRERLELEVEFHRNALDLSVINGIETGLHSIRDVYDLMPSDTDEQIATIAVRLKAIPDAIDGWFAAQLAGIEAGVLPAIRQVDLLASQCANWARPGGYFDQLIERIGADHSALSAELVDDLRSGAALANAAFSSAAYRLRGEIRGLATGVDAVGPERYELFSREFLGAKVDLAETYAWGLSEVARLDEAQTEVAARLRPGLSVSETKAALDADPNYLIEGTDALRDWMQAQADGALRALNGAHFDIPIQALRIECKIAPHHDGGIWYSPPSEDFSRPGRMWWSVPEGINQFGTWRELTTVFHEGTPGHHLQCALALACGDLNRWRRSGLWVSGHGEGWALYAESLMNELGYFADDGMLLGYLDSQQLRAVRVVLDIGLHCGFTAPAEVGGGDWNWDKAWRYFNAHVELNEDQARFEVARYFGWPGQAPSYKVGQRLWQEIRTEVQARQGANFDLKDFHARALRLGSLGLDVLRGALLPAV